KRRSLPAEKQMVASGGRKAPRGRSTPRWRDAARIPVAVTLTPGLSENLCPGWKQVSARSLEEVQGQTALEQDGEMVRRLLPAHDRHRSLLRRVVYFLIALLTLSMALRISGGNSTIARIYS